MTAAFFSFQRGGAIVERSNSDEIIFFLKKSNALDAGSAEFSLDPQIYQILLHFSPNFATLYCTDGRPTDTIYCFAISVFMADPVLLQAHSTPLHCKQLQIFYGTQ